MVITAPNPIPTFDIFESHYKIFLAGGITDCPKWQDTMIEYLDRPGLILLNPRRKYFDVTNPDAAAKQILWEYMQLRLADSILFWFPSETLCPIVLYELGAWSMTEKPIFIGVHPDYARKQDVIIQTRLVRPNIEIVYSLEELANKILTTLQ